MWWDGELAVAAPLGDFFGLGHGEPGELISLPVTAKGAGLSCFWPMPFKHSARIEVTNDGPVLARVYYQVDWNREKTVEPYRFQAGWQRVRESSPGEPVTLAEIKGKGRYVGTMLAVDPQSPGWWGEGDELFYVDSRPPLTPYSPAAAPGEPPTIRGTGTEDWIMQAWGAGALSMPYAGLVEQAGRRVSLYRWYIEDAIPFSQSMTAKMQLQGRDEFRERQDDISSTAFWYQAPPLTTPAELIGYSERLARPAPRPERFEGLVPEKAVPVDLSALADASRFPNTTCQPRASHSLLLPPGIQLLAGVPFLLLAECSGEATAVSLDVPMEIPLPPGPDTLYLLIAAEGERGTAALKVGENTLYFGKQLDSFEDPWPTSEGKMAVIAEKGIGITAIYAVAVHLPSGATSIRLEPEAKATLFAATRL
jgi:hypothetical protein